MESYMTREELAKIGLKEFGEDVKISRRAVIYSPEGIAIGSHVRIDDFTFLSGGGGIAIGDFVHIAAYSALYGRFGIEIGDYVNISSRVAVYSNSDDYSGAYMTGPIVDQAAIHDIGKKILIGSHVIIGTGSTILPGAVLNRGVAVGAMSLVKEELPEFTMYAGIPARFLRERKRDMLRFLGEE